MSVTTVPAIMVERVSVRQCRVHVAWPLVQFLTQDNELLSNIDSLIVRLHDIGGVDSVDRNDWAEIYHETPNEDDTYTLSRDELVDRLLDAKVDTIDCDILASAITDTSHTLVFDVVRRFATHMNWAVFANEVHDAVIAFCAPHPVDLVSVYGAEEDF